MTRKEVLNGLSKWKGSTKRSTTPEQKAEIMHRLIQVWRDNPELRFLQLINNVFHGDTYYIEDYEFIEFLEKSYEDKANQR